jgi:hypothetical protein
MNDVLAFHRGPGETFLPERVIFYFHHIIQYVMAKSISQSISPLAMVCSISTFSNVLSSRKNLDLDIEQTLYIF